MIEIKFSDNLLKELGKESKTNQKENPPNNKNTDRDRDKEKNVISNSKINKAKTFETGKRTDRFGNMIIHGGNHKVTFIDRVSKNNFTEVVKVENYKEYNKMEDSSNNKGNGCCLIL